MFNTYLLFTWSGITLLLVLVYYRTVCYFLNLKHNLNLIEPLDWIMRIVTVVFFNDCKNVSSYITNKYLFLTLTETWQVRLLFYWSLQLGMYNTLTFNTKYNNIAFSLPENLTGWVGGWVTFTLMLEYTEQLVPLLW